MFFVLCVILIAANAQAADDCLTPNDEKAKCVPIRSCPVLLNGLNDPKNYLFLTLSDCGDRIDDGLVCCGSAYNFFENEENQFIDKQVCGYQHSDDYLHTINGTVLTDFPWVALIGYKHKVKGILPISRRHHCSGSLIHSRYILTTASCLSKPDVMPITVRLGEYNIANDTDCIEDAVYECADDVQNFGIEEVIVHPDFNKKHKLHDIGLIKLNKTVQYTDYIRPVCLPSPNKTYSRPGHTLVTSGWEWKDASETKTTIYLTSISNNDCKAIYYNTSIALSDSIMCATPKNNSSICEGDLGGSVIFSKKHRWYQEAIISYTTSCRTLLPEVFTRVNPYLDWINENIGIK